MNRVTFFRIALAALGVGSVFIAPPWVPAVCALLLALRWRAWEVLAIGVLTDLVWLSGSFFYGLPLATLFAVGLLSLLEPFRNELLVDRSAL